jgi:UDP-N-acetylmuramate--alanine ligase
VAGKVEPLFVEHIADLPQVIAEQAKGGDVVICMGAGSIGGVPTRMVDLLQKKKHNLG